MYIQYTYIYISMPIILRARITLGDYSAYKLFMLETKHHLYENN